MKIIIRAVLVIIFMLIGFAAGFPIGQSRGFATGSEWAFVQASLIAREHGLFLPVHFTEGHFRIVLKEPHDLRQRTRQLAEKFDADSEYVSSGERDLATNIRLLRSMSLTR